MSSKDRAVTLEEWAYIAIAKHTRKMLKYESRVPKDKNPEDLHQMRVGMRRLRSAIAGFAVALDLPKTVKEKEIAKVARCLGKLRDLDVLLATLTQDYHPELPKKEQKSLDKVIRSLEKKRQQELKLVQDTIDSKFYYNLKQGLQKWLEQPKYQVTGELSIYFVLPDLLLPQVSQLLLHPGWLVGVEVTAEQIHLPEKLNRQAVARLLQQQEPALHSLRKSAKKTRYNLELFERFYGARYHHYLKQIEEIQEVLGQIQDCFVLREVLEQNFQSAIADKMPQLATSLTQTRYRKWQEWTTLQRQFLAETTRNELRQEIQQPLPAKALAD